MNRAVHSKVGLSNSYTPQICVGMTWWQDFMIQSCWFHKRTVEMETVTADTEIHRWPTAIDAKNDTDKQFNR